MYVYVYMYVCVYACIYIYIHARVGVHMHLCRRILFICTVQSLYYMRVYHRCFLAPTSVCVGGLEVAVQCTNKGMCALVACQCLNTDVKRAPYQLQQARCKSLPRAEIPRKRHQLEFDRAWDKAHWLTAWTPPGVGRLYGLQKVSGECQTTEEERGGVHCNPVKTEVWTHAHTFIVWWYVHTFQPMRPGTRWHAAAQVQEGLVTEGKGATTCSPKMGRVEVV